MEIKIKLQKILIRDQKTGETFTVRTLRTAQEIAEFIDESEKEVITSKIEETICERTTHYNSTNQRGNQS